ncbi:antibiotic biosynthesis monooxygenase family protein [Bacillus sp. AK128]
MIARVWRGWTSEGNADAYENLLRTTILPSFSKIDGYLGGTILRAIQNQDEVEFIITNYFASLDSILDFASQEDFTIAVIEPEARELLSRVDTHATHYQVKEAFQLEGFFKGD